MSTFNGIILLAAGLAIWLIFALYELKHQSEERIQRRTIRGSRRIAKLRNPATEHQTIAPSMLR